MRKKCHIKQMAVTLAASMLTSVLAPAMPAYANQTMPGRAYVFDLGIYSKYNNGTLGLDKDNDSNSPYYGMEWFGTSTSGYITTQNVIRNELNKDNTVIPDDTNANGQQSDPAGSIELPWWDAEWMTLKTQLDAWDGTGTKPVLANNPKSWNGQDFNFPGYMLYGWTKDAVQSGSTISNREHKLNKTMPYGKTVLHAVYLSDGTKFNMKTQHHIPTLPSDTYPGNILTEEAAYQTFEQPQARPKIVEGYDPEITVKMVEPNSIIIDPATNNPTYTEDAQNETYYGLNVNDASKYLEGQMVNRDIYVYYNYVADQNKTKAINVTHHVIDENGDELFSTIDVKHFYAGEEITGIEPDANMLDYVDLNNNGIQDANEVPRYLLVDGTNAGSGGYAPFFRTATCLTADEQNSTLTTDNGESARAGDIHNYVAKFEGSFDSSNKLTGTMPNQAINVDYYYIPNPAFALSLTVKYVYVDGAGQELNVTPAVLTELGNSLPNGFTVETDGNGEATGLIGTAGATENKSFPVPNLTGEGYKWDATSPSYSYTVTNNGTLGANGLTDEHMTSQTMSAHFNNDSVLVTVKYSVDESQFQKVTLTKQGNGVIKNSLDQTEYSNNQANPYKLHLNNDGNGTLSYSDLESMIVPEPATGYDFDGWYYNGTKVTGDIEMTPDTGWTLQARFVRNNLWKNFIFTWNGANGTVNGASNNPFSRTVQLLPYDAATNDPRDVLWSEIEPSSATAEFASQIPQITADTDFVVKWYDSQNQELDADTIISDYADGEVFTAVCEPTTAITPESPTAEAVIDENTGEVQIVIDTDATNVQSYAYYAVADSDGNVVAVVRGDVLTNMDGVISGGLYPGETYTVHEVIPSAGAGLSQGDSIASLVTDGTASVPTSVTTPICTDVGVEDDPNNNGQKQIVINITSPDTDYALLDENGNVVEDWQQPSAPGGSITWDNLDPDTTYQIVVRPSGSNDTAANRQPSKVVITNSSVVLGDGYRLEVVSEGANITIEDENNNSLGDGNIAESVPSGTMVHVTTDVIANGATFDHWEIVMGHPSSVNAVSTALQFEMPEETVIIQAVYDHSSSVASWSNAEYQQPSGDNQNMGALTPDWDETITGPGKFRVRMWKDAATQAEKEAIKIAENIEDGINEYRALYAVNIQIEKLVGGQWRPAANIGDRDITTYLETGALRDDVEYSFYEIATGSNATPSDAEEFLSKVDIEGQLSQAEELGYFDINLVNGKRYVFGYRTLPVYVVKIKNGNGRPSTSQIVPVTLTIPEGDTVGDFENRYRQAVNGCLPSPSGVPDRDGLLWWYIGLSEEQDTWVEYDVHSRLNGSVTELFLFYENDKEYRDAAEENLKDRIDEIQEILDDSRYVVSNRDDLKNAVDEAQRLIDQRNPRKASTAELEEMLDELNRVYANSNPYKPGNGGSSGGSSGGSGGGGGSSTSTGTVTNSSQNGAYLSKYGTYAVGTDGYWNNLDPVEHIWEFVLHDGSRLRDTWANLSYTPPGGESRTYTYHFGADGIMDTGWFLDDDGSWYYLSLADDGFYGRLVLGWHYDMYDGKWYYLGRNDGIMRTGWQNISGKWYYFTPSNNKQTWSFDEALDKWVYTGNEERPFGSMYEGEMTPDYYHVDSNGVWIQ